LTLQLSAPPFAQCPWLIWYARYLSPDGIVELLESRLVLESDDNSIPPGGYLEQYVNAIAASTKLAGLEDVPPKLESYLRNAGFVDIKVSIRKIPIGAWAKDPKKKVRQFRTHLEYRLMMAVGKGTWSVGDGHH
jgi:hypothetical protein